MDRCASRLNDWNTMPMVRLRMRDVALSESDETALPLILYVPVVGWMSMPNRLSMVDLPDPDGPITVRNAPSGMDSVVGRSASITTPPAIYCFDKLMSSIMECPVPFFRYDDTLTSNTVSPSERPSQIST